MTRLEKIIQNIILNLKAIPHLHHRKHITENHNVSCVLSETINLLFALIAAMNNKIH